MQKLVRTTFLITLLLGILVLAYAGNKNRTLEKTISTPTIEAKVVAER